MELTQARLKELLNYDPDAGIFTWKVQTANHIMVGDVVGAHHHGYMRIRLDKKLYTAHQLVWLFMTGDFPVRGMRIEHINNIRNDNRWENLRLVANQENSTSKSNTSEVVGVVWCIRHKKWMAEIWFCGELIHLGLFDEENDAVSARLDAEYRFGFHTNQRKGVVGSTSD